MKRIINHLFIITSLLSFLIFFIVTFCVPFHVAHASTINKSASTTASGLTNTDLTNGLIAYYPFDGKYMTWTSSTAGTAVDASVNKYNGTLVNMNQSINSVGGKIGQALNFNSSTAVEQYINTNNYIIQSFPFSVCMWVNPILTGQTHMLIDQYNLQFYLQDNGSQLGLGFYNNYTMPGLTYGNIKPNVWNFACVTAGPGSSVATTTLYVNGSIVTGPTSFTQIGFSNQTTYIGYPYGGADPTAAKLDDIRIYNRALSAMEVQQLYQYGLTTIDNTNVNLTNRDLGPSGGSSSASGLTAYYPFSGQYMTWQSGTNTVGTSTDASGNGYNGTLINMNRTTSVVTGRSGQALNFVNGANSYVQGSTSLIAAGTASACAWIKQSSFVGTNNAIVANMKFQFFTSSSVNSVTNTIGLTSNGSTVATGASNVIVNGVWQFVCGTRDTSGNANLYVNGALSGSPNQTSGTPASSGLNPVNIGTVGNHSGNFFAGSIADVRIYGRVLSAQEITQLYTMTKGDVVNKSDTGLTNTDLTSASSTSGGNPSGLVGYWPFDGKYMTWKSGTNTVGTSTDASGNGYNGTLINMNRTSSIVLGKVGQALSLNSTSTNSYVNVGATANNIKTVAFWFKPNSITQSILALSSTVNITTASDVLTATGFTSPTIYIDGVNSAANPTASTTVVSGWHFIVVTTATPINANAVTLGQVGTAYFSGILDDVRLYSRVLSAREVKQLYDMTGGTSPAGGGGSAGCGAHTITGPDGLTYGTVLGADGNCWLDRNLGATEVATSSTDWKSYGSLYQWGRLSDGHQLITWTNGTTGTPVNGTTITMSTTTTPINNLFILGSSTQANDWIYPPTNNTLWQGLRGINNPCPVGFAIPTAAQWVTLVADSNITNSASAFGSTLKLPEEGYRIFNSGGFNFVGTFGYYWSNSPSGQNTYYMEFNSTSVNPSTPASRASGYAIRCVKD